VHLGAPCFNFTESSKKNDVLKFIIALAATALVLLGVLQLCIYNHWLDNAPSFSRESIALLFITNLIIFYYLNRLSKDIFVQLYLLSMTLKILAYASFILIIILKNKDGAPANVVFFLIAYSIFTALEVAFLYKRFGPSGVS
jgi:hypothetical protein